MNDDYGAETAIMLELYEAQVGNEMLERVGRNQRGKGVVHEILYRDQLNRNPQILLAGKHAELTKSTTAIRDDIVVMQGKNVVGRAQLKDTPASINKTIQQASSKKYAGTKLLGTQETTAAYAEKAANRASWGENISQEMSSTGISSKDTQRIADKALGNTISPECIFSGAVTAGKIGGAISACLTVLSMVADGDDYTVGEVAEETVKSAAVGTASGTAGFVGGELTQMCSVSAAGTILPTVAAVGGAIAAADMAATIAKPTVEGIADAFLCGAPELALYGLEEGIGDCVDKVGECIGGIFDGISDIADGIGDFFDNLFW